MNMANTTFSGPIKAGTIKYTTGTTVGTDKANVGFVLMAQSANVVFGANGTETVVATVPANSQIYQIAVDVTTAFDAGTTNTFDIGDGSTADQYADALAVGTAARVLATSDVSQIGNLDRHGSNCRCGDGDGAVSAKPQPFVRERRYGKF
jgi:hypothetical protein